jgi:hypothetical protein
MKRFEDQVVVGDLAVQDLRVTDDLLDRLGRRQPRSQDLDDPVAGSLAVFAGDVDRLEVPAERTRRAILATGCWPPVPAETPGNGGPSMLPMTALAAPRAMPGRESAAGAVPLRRFGRSPRISAGSTGRTGGGVATSTSRRADRVSPRLDHPRLLRMRPAVGVAAAALFVVLGSGLSGEVTSGHSINPIAGLTRVVDRLTGERTDAERRAQRQLSAEVAQARTALEAGDPAQAEQLIERVRRQFATLADGDQRDLAQQITTVESAMPRAGLGDDAATGSPGQSASSRQPSTQPAITGSWSARRISSTDSSPAGTVPTDAGLPSGGNDPVVARPAATASTPTTTRVPDTGASKAAVADVAGSSTSSDRTSSARTSSDRTSSDRTSSDPTAATSGGAGTPGGSSAPVPTSSVVSGSLPRVRQRLVAPGLSTGTPSAS